jgi:hypothetical protein
MERPAFLMHVLRINLPRYEEQRNPVGERFGNTGGGIGSSRSSGGKENTDFPGSPGIAVCHERARLFIPAKNMTKRLASFRLRGISLERVVNSHAVRARHAEDVSHSRS